MRIVDEFQPHDDLHLDDVVLFLDSLGGVQRLNFVCSFLSSCTGWWGPEVGLSFSNFVLPSDHGCPVSSISALSLSC